MRLSKASALERSQRAPFLLDQGFARLPRRAATDDMARRPASFGTKRKRGAARGVSWVMVSSRQRSPELVLPLRGEEEPSGIPEDAITDGMQATGACTTASPCTSR